MSDAPQPGQRPGAPARAGGRTQAETARLVLAVIAGCLLLAFILLNTQQVSVNWVVTTTKTPLIVVILISLAVGGVLFAAAFRKRKRSADRKRRAARDQRARPTE